MLTRPGKWLKYPINIGLRDVIWCKLTSILVETPINCNGSHPKRGEIRFTKASIPLHERSRRLDYSVKALGIYQSKSAAYVTEALKEPTVSTQAVEKFLIKSAEFLTDKKHPARVRGRAGSIDLWAGPELIQRD